MFWDIDTFRLSVKKDKDIIISRALFATTQASFEIDIQRLEELYSRKEMISILKNSKERISNEVCVLATKRYNAKPFLSYSL